MKKNLLLYILLIFLIVVNGFFLYNYLGNGSSEKPKGPPGVGSFIVKELGFNDTQLEAFKTLSQRHHHRMRNLSDDVKVLKDAMFNGLFEVTENKPVIDSITLLIGDKEKEKEREVFHHFKKVQQLCDENQKVKFQKIIKDALRKGGREQRPPRQGGDGYRPPPRH